MSAFSYEMLVGRKKTAAGFELWKMGHILTQVFFNRLCVHG